MFQFFTEDYAGFPAQTLNWIALGISILVALLILWLVIKLFRGSRLGNGRRGRHARLAVTDAASIGDDRRKLVLVRRDNVEHLLLIGGSNDLVIESDIVRTAPQQTAARTPLATPAATTPSPAPVTNVPKPAAAAPAPVTPAPVQPTVAPAAVVPAPQTPAPAPVAAPLTPTPAPVATPATAPLITPPPAPSTSAAPVAVAAATVTAATIASTTPAETITKPDEKAIDDTELDAIEIWDNTSVKNAPQGASEINIDKPVAEPVVTAAVQTKSASPMNSVEEMDALLNEITTEK